MKSFIFQTARCIINEPGATSRLGEIAAGLGMSKVFLVSDKGIAKAGLLDKAVLGLRAGGMDVAVFTDVLADPPESNVLEALKLAQEFCADGVVGFGGGSSMDVAKLVAFLSRSAQTLPEIYGIGLAQGPRLPLIQVTTTAGTGSEVTPIAIQVDQ
jgi:alcohol dehydrogenase class IV